MADLVAFIIGVRSEESTESPWFIVSNSLHLFAPFVFIILTWRKGVIVSSKDSRAGIPPQLFPSSSRAEAETGVTFEHQRIALVDILLRWALLLSPSELLFPPAAVNEKISLSGLKGHILHLRSLQLCSWHLHPLLDHFLSWVFCPHSS